MELLPEGRGRHPVSDIVDTGVSIKHCGRCNNERVCDLFKID